jgi:Fibronectin type III domain
MFQNIAISVAVDMDSSPSFQQVPGQPRSVLTRVITSDSVLVTWQAPTDGGPISGYMIGYGEGVPDVNWQYLEPHRRNVTIKNLSQCASIVN